MPSMPDVPDVLYHYTNTGGLLGILADPVSFPGTDEGTFATEKGATFGTLWATDARYLNDAQELTFGAAVLTEKLKDAAQSAAIPVVADRLRELAEDVEHRRFEVSLGSTVKQTRPHVTCFCTTGDLLSQWRGYGDGGGGYAIGFSRAAFESCITVDTDLHKTDPQFAVLPAPQPVKVQYGSTRAAEFLEAAVGEIAYGLEAVEHGTKDYAWPDAFRSICAKWLARVKHGAFEEEDEWRLILDRRNVRETYFRAGRIGLVPYVKLHFPIITKSAGPSIKQIVIGPGGERELREEALERLLAKVGSTETVISLSDAPYRQ